MKSGPDRVELRVADVALFVFELNVAKEGNVATLVDLVVREWRRITCDDCKWRRGQNNRLERIIKHYDKESQLNLCNELTQILPIAIERLCDGEASCWQEGGPMSNDDPLTTTRVDSEI